MGKLVPDYILNEAIGRLPKIDLLWENINATNDDDGLNPFEGSVDLPSADYDYFEVVFFRGFETQIVCRVCRDAGAIAEYFTVDADEIHRIYRNVSVNVEEAMMYFGDGNDEATDWRGSGGTATSNTILVPYRIYGIKGVNEGFVTSSFTIDGVSYTFIDGMTWSDWCSSKYNTIGLYPTEENVVTDNSDTLADSADDPVAPSDAIVDGMAYVLL